MLRLRRSATAGEFLDGVNVASVALMAVVTWEFVRISAVESSSPVLELPSAAILLRSRINSTWLILAGPVGAMFATAISAA